MMSRLTLILLFCHCTYKAQGSGRPELETEVIREWNTVRYLFQNKNTEKNFLENGRLIPENLQISGLAADSKLVYLTVPRMKSSEGVPYTLATISNSYKRTGLKPFPKERTGEEVGNCKMLQNPLSLELHHDMKKLYVADTGRIGVLSDNPVVKCPPKIVRYDTKTYKKNIYYLHENVVSKEESILSALVLDFTTHTHRGNKPKYIYIADSGLDQLVVYDVTNNATWSYGHKSLAENSHNKITINGEEIDVGLGVNALAMSPDFNYLYYTPTGSRALYQIPTWVLRKPDSGDISSHVRNIGDKVSNSAGMYHGVDALYYTAIEEDAVYKWDVRKDEIEQKVDEGKVEMVSQVFIAKNFETMKWPDSVTLDNEGYLYFTTTQSHLFYGGKIDFNDKNAKHFRVFKVKVGDYSYTDEMLPEDDDDIF